VFAIMACGIDFMFQLQMCMGMEINVIRMKFHNDIRIPMALFAVLSILYLLKLS